MTPTVLVVDDDNGVRFTIRSVLEDAGLEVVEARDGLEALAVLDAGAAVDLVITDLRMPRMTGLELLEALSGRTDAPRVILITAHGDERTAVSAMKAGAWDYFRKPFDPDELVAVVRRATETVRLAGEVERLAGELNLARSMVFVSPGMARLAGLVQRLGRRDVGVLITGESGTGKERVAEALVRVSSRASKPFVRFNCASLGSELAEAELFGHTKGAFTGAVRARPGLFREADGGTLLLDEVGELPPLVQARLLRVLQSGEVRPVGEDRPVRIDVRILAATHRDLEAMVADGSFREDLYYRLKVVHLHVPPLRERPEDIPALARHFLDRYCERYGLRGLVEPEGLMADLAARSWPGNVRELENACEMLVALSDGSVDVGLLEQEGHVEVSGGLRARVDAYERALIQAALRETGGNKSAAAERLGIGRVTLYEKLEKHGL
ncbi:MAG: sigma-54 dependent transcriptional regulator [Myxococcota bacterium]